MTRTVLKAVLVIAALGLLTQDASAFGHRWGRCGWGGGWGMGSAYPAYAPPPPCRVTFEIRADRVASFTRSGGGCVATPPDG